MFRYMKRILMTLLPILLVCCSSGNIEGQKAVFTIGENLLNGIEIPANKYEKTFPVTSDADWEIVRRSGQQWIDIAPAKGNGDGSVTVYAEKNNSGQRRRAFFDVKINGVKSYVIEICQTLEVVEEQEPDQGGEGDTPDPSDPVVPEVPEEFPIIAWADIPEDKSAERFPSMKAAGINIYLGIYTDLKTALSVLDIAHNAGVKLILQCPELLTDPVSTVKAIMNHPALYGYFVEDEPGRNDFAQWAEIVKAVQSVDSKHVCYINIYPNWAWGKIDKYPTNVNDYLNTVPVRMLSFDNYPVVSINDAPNSLRYDWYFNLEVIMEASKSRNIPFWAFARANSKEWEYEGDKIFYPIPTTQELRAQMFTNLAYGAQGLQYFTYWGLETNSGKTRVYERAQAVNADIRALSKVFLGCNVISVGHTGELPIGTKALGQLPSVFSKLETSSGAVVSHIENGDKYYLVIVNRSIQESMTLTIEADASVQRVLKNGNVVAMTGTTYNIIEGDMEIFCWNK